MSADFQLESQDPNGPVVGDRYVLRTKTAAIIGVTPTHVELAVSDPYGSFLKTVTLAEFATLEKRTLDAGAVFKPAQNKSPNCPQ